MLPLLLLLAIGTGWGLTQPLSKIAVSTGHGYFGLIVWQLVYMSVLLSAFNRLRGKGLPLAWRYMWRYALIALLGTIIPNSVGYQAAVHLPAGFLSILISLVPMFALPLALLLRMERASAGRILGVFCGALAVFLMVGPKSSLPDASMVPWILIACLSPFFYALEGTWVARQGTLDLDPVQLLLGASLFGLLIAVPLALASGQWIDPGRPWGAPEWALLLSSVIHAVVYSAYVWLVGKAGSVFASQVSYVVTGSGVLWSMSLLGEQYSAFVWAAFGVMLLGLFLVRPRAPRTA